MPYRLMYEVEIRHEGLGAYRHIRGSDQQVVMQKAQAQQRVWDERWKRNQDKEATLNQKLAKKELAQARTSAAFAALSKIETTLTSALTVDPTLDWESMKDRSPYSIPRPDPAPHEPLPREPRINDSDFEPRLSLLDRLSSSRRAQRTKEAIARFEEAHTRWKVACEGISRVNRQRDDEHQRQLNTWEKKKMSFLEAQAENHRLVENRRELYSAKSSDAIVEYCDSVLSKSEYPDSFPQSFELEYVPETKTLIVDYQLPALDDLPKIKEVKYVASRDELVETKISESTLRKIYDELLYKIGLRSLYELFEADVVEAIDSVVFNGWVQSIDRGTGQDITPCILSLQARKAEFSQINLANADPKACFKKLKGVGSSKLSELAPIRPILTLNKEDRRFVSAYDVAETLDDSINIAAMDWKDFENLIRELFEKVFSVNGGEVKITQASRDGGVDAVAFDPDPIRGGKIVIQAKRYTNTVGLSAVRDLYGTVHNEGAIKGILVTTADYGPDAYSFAKDKPLTLLNGSHLLHLLAQHGHKAKIDLREAKQSFTK